MRGRSISLGKVVETLYGGCRPGHGLGQHLPLQHSSQRSPFDLCPNSTIGLCDVPPSLVILFRECGSSVSYTVTSHWVRQDTPESGLEYRANLIAQGEN